MSYSVSFEPESIKDLDDLAQVMRIRILNKISWLGINFEQITPLPLTGQKRRVGIWVYFINISRCHQELALASLHLEEVIVKLECNHFFWLRKLGIGYL